MRRGSTFWGLALLLAGILFLLDSLQIIRINAWSLLGPLFLVLIGVWILWGAVAKPQVTAVQSASIPLEGASRASIRVRHGAGRLTVSSGASGADLVTGTFGGGLDLRTRRHGDTLDVKMRMQVDNLWGPWSWSPQGLNWDFKLNGAIPLALDFQVGASENVLDMTGLCVSDLALRTGAGSTRVVLLSSGQTRVEIRGGAASIALLVPQGVAARVRAHGGVAGIRLDTRRFPHSGDEYQSPDYGTAANKVDIQANLGAGSLEVS